MIDGIKLDVGHRSEDELKANPHLDWTESMKSDTGELIYPAFTRIHNLKCEIKGHRTRLITGSLHKFHNSYTHEENTNINDFYYDQIIKSIDKLVEVFNVNPSRTRVINLEVGLNIRTSFNPSEMLNNNLICYDYKKLKSENKEKSNHGQYVEFSVTGMYVKVYDKGRQYKRDEYILRSELKIIRSEKLQQVSEIQYLSDLYDKKKLKNLLEYLYTCFDRLLIIDPYVDSEIKPEHRTMMLKGSNPIFWQGIKGKKKQRYKEKFLTTLEDYNLTKWQKEINQKLRVKGSDLMSQCHKMNDFDNTAESSDMSQNENLIKVHSMTSRKYPDWVYELPYDHPDRKKLRNARSNPKNNLIRRLQKNETQSFLFPIEEVIQLSEDQKDLIKDTAYSFLA